MSNQDSTLIPEQYQTPSKDIVLLNLPDAARALSIHPETLRRWCRLGRIRCINISTSKVKPTYRIPFTVIEEYIKAQEVK